MQATKVETLAKKRPISLNDSQQEFSLVSYNLLAQIYLQSNDFWGHLDKDVVDANKRKSLILEEMMSLDADIYTFQEVAAKDGFNQDFGEQFRDKGYDFVVQNSKKAKENHPVANAVVFRKDKFSLAMEDSRSRTIIVALQRISQECKEDSDYLYIVNVHLEVLQEK